MFYHQTLGDQSAGLPKLSKIFEDLEVVNDPTVVLVRPETSCMRLTTAQRWRPCQVRQLSCRFRPEAFDW